MAAFGSSAKIPCCLCGMMILPNAAAQCSSCLASQFDLTALLNGSDVQVNRCKRCLRYQNGPGDKHYQYMEGESQELMALCLKSIPALTNHGQVQAVSGVQGIKLVDSSWVWTEPHSKRLKLRVTVKAEIIDASVTVQQRCLVTLVERNKQCGDCNKQFTNQTWSGIVQLREKRGDEGKRNLLRVEYALSRSKEIRRRVVNLEVSKNGFDFYFQTLHDAQGFASFLGRIAPTRVKQTRKLVSTDNHSNSANIKTTFVCDLVPLEKDDLVICDKRAPGGGGGFLRGRLGLVTKVSSTVKMISASPGRDSKIEDISCELGHEAYWKGEKFYRVLLSAKRLMKFVVMDVDICGVEDWGQTDGARDSGIADVMVMRESDFGVNDEMLSCVSHLGHLLEVGDVVQGYDLTTTVVGDEALYEGSFVSSFEIPDVVLVRKLKAGGASVSRETEEDEATPSPEEKKKPGRRQRKKKLLKDTKEKQGRGYRGAKRQNEFEGHLEAMGFLDDENERLKEAMEDVEDEERDEFEREVEEVEKRLMEEVLGEEDGVLTEAEEIVRDAGAKVEEHL